MGRTVGSVSSRGGISGFGSIGDRLIAVVQVPSVGKVGLAAADSGCKGDGSVSADGLLGDVANGGQTVNNYSHTLGGLFVRAFVTNGNSVKECAGFLSGGRINIIATFFRPSFSIVDRHFPRIFIISREISTRNSYRKIRGFVIEAVIGSTANSRHRQCGGLDDGVLNLNRTAVAVANGDHVVASGQVVEGLADSQRAFLVIA